MRFKLAAWLIAATFCLIIASCVPPDQMKAADQSLRSGKVEDAYQEYLKLSKQYPDDPEVNKGLAHTRQLLLTRYMDRSAAILGQGEVTKPALMQALAVLEEAKPFDPAMKELGPQIAHIQGLVTKIDQANGERAALAEKGMAMGDFQSARKNLDLIAASDPDHPRLAGLRQSWTMGHADQLEQKIRAHLEAGEIAQAQPLITQWTALDLPAQRKQQFGAYIRQQGRAGLKARVEALMAGRQYLKAWQLVKQSGAENDVGGLVAELRAQGAAHYLKTTQKELHAGNLARAYLESVKGLMFSPRQPTIFALHRDIQDQMLARLQKYIAIPAFGAPTNAPDLGPQFSDALISYLFRVLPYGINILERQKVDLMFAEQKMGTMEVAQRLAANLVVTGNVSLLKVDRQESTGRVNAKVKVGDTQALNPAYQAWLKLTPEERKQTPQPAQTINQPVYQDVVYNKGQVTLKGFGSVAMRIFDPSKGAIVFAQEFNATEQSTDQFQDSVPHAGIQGDALELPSQTEVREKLRDALVKQVASVIRKQFSGVHGRYLQEARYHLSRNEPAMGVESLALGYLHAVKSNVPADDPDFVAIRQMVLELTEGPR